MNDLLKERIKPGEIVKIFLLKGGEVHGVVKEIGENYLVLEGNIHEITLSNKLIGGWQKETVQKQIQLDNTLIPVSEGKEVERKAQIPEQFAIRNLGKVGIEFKVSMNRIVEFLRSKDEHLENSNSPNAKISEQQYQMLLKEFIPKEEKQNFKLDGKQELEMSDNGEEFVKQVPIHLYAEIPWKELGLPDEHLFKGREELLDRLKRHYISTNRSKSYILYGLTRSGKSSVLKYLAKELENQKLIIEDKAYTFIPFIWQFEEAASQDNASDMWNFLLKTNTLDKIKKLIIEQKVPNGLLPNISGDLRFKHMREIIQHLKKYNYYPIFFIDEFTYFKNLHDSGQLTSAFLSSIRGYAFGNLASFVFAGTYDLGNLIRLPEYGITGQLVNTIDEKVERIKSKYARELMNVWSERLQFNEDAIAHILRLSGSIPYFIQLICKSCGFYALEQEKKILDFDDVEKVAKIITGEVRIPLNSHMESLSLGTFNSNQYNPQDPREVHALVSTICHLNKNEIIQKGLRFDEILNVWGEKRIPKLNMRISSSVETLKERGIIWENKKGEFKISADLFRRWWFNQHPNLDLELNFLFDN